MRRLPQGGCLNTKTKKQTKQKQNKQTKQTTKQKPTKQKNKNKTTKLQTTHLEIIFLIIYIITEDATSDLLVPITPDGPRLAQPTT